MSKLTAGIECHRQVDCNARVNDECLADMFAFYAVLDTNRNPPETIAPETIASNSLFDKQSATDAVYEELIFMLPLHDIEIVDLTSMKCFRRLLYPQSQVAFQDGRLWCLPTLQRHLLLSMA